MVWYWDGPDAYTTAKAGDIANSHAGFIFQKGAMDFAGGTVVHINSGIAALVCRADAGKRAGLRQGIHGAAQPDDDGHRHRHAVDGLVRFQRRFRPGGDRRRRHWPSSIPCSAPLLPASLGRWSSGSSRASPASWASARASSRDWWRSRRRPAMSARSAPLPPARSPPVICFFFVTKVKHLFGMTTRSTLSACTASAGSRLPRHRHFRQPEVRRHRRL